MDKTNIEYQKLFVGLHQDFAMSFWATLGY